MQLIAEYHLGHWSARFVDDSAREKRLMCFERANVVVGGEFGMTGTLEVACLDHSPDVITMRDDGIGGIREPRV